MLILKDKLIGLMKSALVEMNQYLESKGAGDFLRHHCYLAMNRAWKWDIPFELPQRV